MNDQSHGSFRTIEWLTLTVGAVIVGCGGVNQTSADPVDPAVLAYQARANTILQGNLTALKSWAATNAGVADNASPGSLCIWTAAAGFSQAASDPAALSAARKLAAGVMEYQVNHLFVGGNDGWPAWATTDTRVRYGSLIVSDTNRYAPTGYAANPNSPDGKYSLDDLFRIVLTQSYYAPIDSTSNHVLMNATARFLAEMAYPGQVVKGYNNSTTNPTGANILLSVANNLTAAGPGEYGSPNYGADNWGEFLSLSQLTDPSVGTTGTAVSLYATVKQAATTAYACAVAQIGAFWMNGNLAMSTGRGYPSTGAWGVSAGDVLSWVYFGGDFGSSSINTTVSNTGIKTLGALGAEGLTVGGYMPPLGTLHLVDPVPRVSRANFDASHQYSYMTANYGHSSESNKYTGGGAKQTHWDSRVVWTKPYDQTYQATAWVENVAVNATLVNGIPTPTLDSGGNPISVDPFTLQPYPLYGSGTYGVTPFEDFTQYLDTVLHVYNIPPRNLTGTPGGTMPTRGALIYVPIPEVKNASGTWVIGTTQYIPPEISTDGHRVFVGYNNVFISFNSSAPIATPISTDVIFSRNAQFFRIYGGPNADDQVDQSQYIQFAVAVQTASPDDYPGATLAEKFTTFKSAMLMRQAPRMVKIDLLHPVWQFSDGQVTLTNTYQGDTYHGGNDGRGQDWIGGPNNENQTVIDYSSWPELEERFVSGGPPLLYQQQGGNLTVNYPGTPSAFYDFDKDTLTIGTNVGLNVISTGPATATLAWSGTFGQTGWLVERSIDGITWSLVPGASNLPADALSYTETGLTQGANYYYRVTPLGTTYSASAPASTLAQFGAPSGLQLRVTGTNALTLTWTNNAVGAVNTRLQWAEDGSEQWTTFDNRTPTQNSYTVSNIPSGTRRYYRVLAVSATASSQPSNRVGTEVSAAYVGTTLSMPEYLTAMRSGSQIVLNWMNTATSAAANWLVRSNDAGITWTVLNSTLPANVNSYVDVTATASAIYTYKLSVSSGSALSAYSNEASAIVGNNSMAIFSYIHQPAILPVDTSHYSVEWLSYPGKNYLLQQSADLKTWYNSGPVITATSNLASYTVSSTAAKMFFRIIGNP